MDVVGLLKYFFRMLAAWLERKIQTYDEDRKRREAAERNRREAEAKRRISEMADGIGAGDLATVERLMRERGMRNDPRFGPSS